MTAARRKVDLDAVAERCRALKLVHAAECLPELVEEASREDLSPVRFFDRMLEREIERKDERRVATSLRLRGLPVGKTLKGFDWTFKPRVDRSKIDALATCAYVRQRENVLFMGPPGVGKSHLAVALGVKAIMNGFSATHYVLDDLMHVLKGDAAIPPRRLKAKRYRNSSLFHLEVRRDAMSASRRAHSPRGLRACAGPLSAPVALGPNRCQRSSSSRDAWR